MDKFYYGREGLLDMGLLLIITVIYIVMRKSAEYPAFTNPVIDGSYLLRRLTC